jgi:Universal stress protein family
MACGQAWPSASRREPRVPIPSEHGPRGPARTVAPGVDVTAVTEVGLPAGLLVDASRSADLMVIGTRGHGGLLNLAVGSVAASVAANGRCPVMIVRGAADGFPGPARGTVQDGGDLRLADRTLAQEVLNAAVAWLRKEHPDVAVTPFLAQGRPAAALIRGGPDAELLVVGLEGTGPSPGCCSAR